MSEQNSPADIRKRLKEASRSFRKLDGRHLLRTPDVMYCSFTTPMFTVEPHEAQRDSAKRIARFGLSKRRVRGKSVLDLGCNAGAMLFQLTSMGIKSGLGVEFDADKVELAREIAELSGLSQLKFECGDIDRLQPDELGQFDVVLALAIEAHVLNPDRLYRLLGQVTHRTLCFEGNNRADVDAITERLKANGFRRVRFIGPCDDDIMEENNTRPMIIATK